MIYFHNKCKCDCEYNAVRTLRNANDYTESVHRGIIDLLITAGVLVDAGDRRGEIRYEDKYYKVKKVK